MAVDERGMAYWNLKLLDELKSSSCKSNKCNTEVIKT